MSVRNITQRSIPQMLQAISPAISAPSASDGGISLSASGSGNKVQISNILISKHDTLKHLGQGLLDLILKAKLSYHQLAN